MALDELSMTKSRVVTKENWLRITKTALQHSQVGELNHNLEAGNLSEAREMPKMHLSNARKTSEQGRLTDTLATELVMHVPRTQPLAAERNVETTLEELFDEFIASSTEFSRAIFHIAHDRIERDPAKNARSNLTIAKTIFSKWVIEIMTVLYQGNDVGFEQLRKQIGNISPRMLSLKLTRLQKLGLVHREVLAGRPPRVNYSLTKKGEAVARLGEPVFLFLRFQSGLLFSSSFKDIAPLD